MAVRPIVVNKLAERRTAALRSALGFTKSEKKGDGLVCGFRCDWRAMRVASKAKNEHVVTVIIMAAKTASPNGTKPDGKSP